MFFRCGGVRFVSCGVRSDFAQNPAVGFGTKSWSDLAQHPGQILNKILVGFGIKSRLDLAVVGSGSGICSYSEGGRICVCVVVCVCESIKKSLKIPLQS